MKVSELKANQRIEISIDDELSEYKKLASRIEEITTDYLHISVPMVRGELLPLRIGTKVKINFANKDNAYYFNSIIVDRKNDRIPILIIKKPENFIKIQRRQWVRVPAIIDIHFKAQKHQDDEKVEQYKGSTIDISGGGMLFYTSDPVENGQVLDIKIDLPDRQSLFCKAKIIRILEKASEKGKKNKAILEYTDINEGDRDKLVNFIFEKQREWIRKGIL